MCVYSEVGTCEKLASASVRCSMTVLKIVSTIVGRTIRREVIDLLAKIVWTRYIRVNPILNVEISVKF